MSRVYKHLSEAGLTFAVDQGKRGVRIAFAACDTADTFNHRTGREIVNAQLDFCDATLRALGLKQNAITVPYEGSRPYQEVLVPLIDFMADPLGERTFFRHLRRFFMEGVVDAETAQAAGAGVAYAQVQNQLDKDDLELLKSLETEEQLYDYFFSWSSSVNALRTNMKKFVSQVRQGNIKLAPKPAATELRQAPRKPAPV